MTDWATKFIPEEQTPPTENPSFNILIEVIQDTIRESMNRLDFENQERRAEDLVVEHDDRLDRVLAGLVSLSEGISQQLMVIVRRIDDIERVIDQSINDAPMTNLMQDAPSVYEKVTRAEPDDEADPDDLIVAYESYLNEEIKWTEFVKMAGGVSNAVLVREQYEDEHSDSDDADE